MSDPIAMLLRNAVRWSVDVATSADVNRSAAAIVEWDRALYLAQAHGVSVLLRRALGEHPASIPPAALAYLDEQQWTDARRRLRQAGTLKQIQEAMMRAGIPMVVLKGPAIAHCAYGDWGCRQSGQDVDILVDPTHVAEVVDVLRPIGFRDMRPLPPYARGFAMAQVGETLLLRDDEIIDLHWRVCMPYYSYCPNTADLIARAQSIRIADVPVMTLSPEDMVVMAAVHGCKERWEQLKWTCDMAMLLTHSSTTTLRHAVARARALGCVTMLLTAYELAHLIAGVSIPVLATLVESAGRPHRLAREAERWLVQGTPRRAWMHARSMDRLSDTLRAATDWARPWPSDWQSLSLPRYMAWMYWVYRPIRHSFKYSRRLLGMTRPSSG